MGEDGVVKLLGNVTISVCTEKDQVWKDLATVPVSTDAKGDLLVPFADAVSGSENENRFSDIRKSQQLFSIRRVFEEQTNVTTYLPLQEIYFEFGKAVPVNRDEFQKNTVFVVEKLRNIIEGRYQCVEWQKTRPVIYVVGHTDRVGREGRNLQLSDKRAQTIASAIHDGLTALQGVNDISVCYFGVGEKETTTPDEVPLPEARRADVLITTEEKPFEADWKCK